MAVLISVTEGDVTQIVLADVGVQGATGPSSPASGTPFTPYGNIAATNVQTAIQELDDEKFGKAGGTVTGNLEIGTGGTLSFEGATADGFETTLAVVDPTADRTLTLPNVTGTFVTTGDTGTVTSTMLLDGTILNADVNASAAIAGTKISPDFGSQTIVTTGRVLVGTDTANTSGAKLQTSDGLTFPATAVASSDPNTLDDYEEGTFTPVINGTSTSGVGVYSIQVGRYTKVGNTITAHCHINWSAHTGTGNMNIGGLPITSANVTNLFPAASVFSDNLTCTGVPVLLVSSGATTAPLFSLNNGATAALAMDVSAAVIATITYQTA
jgi:hypothetical protein